MKHKKETLNLSDMKVGELQPSWRDEVVVEPTEGWVSVSSPVREKESEEVKQIKLHHFSPAAGFLQVTLWDLVKEGSMEQLTVVLDSLKDQVS